MLQQTVFFSYLTYFIICYVTYVVIDWIMSFMTFYIACYRLYKMLYRYKHC